MITLEDEFYYEMEHFTLVAKGSITGEFEVIEEDSFGHTNSIRPRRWNELHHKTITIIINKI